jgi:hypothetical protein
MDLLYKRKWILNQRVGLLDTVNRKTRFWGKIITTVLYMDNASEKSRKMLVDHEALFFGSLKINTLGSSFTMAKD